VGDNVTFGPANNCVTPPLEAYEALIAFDVNDAVKAKEALKTDIEDVCEFSINELVAAFKELVYVNILALNKFIDDVNEFKDAVVANDPVFMLKFNDAVYNFILALKAFNDAVYEFKDAVVANDPVFILPLIMLPVPPPEISTIVSVPLTFFFKNNLPS